MVGRGDVTLGDGTSRQRKRTITHGRCWVFQGIYDNTCIFSRSGIYITLAGFEQAIEYIYRDDLLLADQRVKE